MTHCMHWLKACIGKKTNDNFLFLAACHGAFHFDAFAVDQQSSTVGGLNMKSQSKTNLKMPWNN